MKIGVIGTGYVGITLACLVDFGHDVVMVGKTKEKADMINRGASPIYEPGLDDVLKTGVDKGKLKATIDYNEIRDADVIFNCVGTPSRDDGSIDLSQIEESSKSIGEQLKQSNKYQVVVVKSTVVPKTTIDFVLPILEKYSGKKSGQDFGVGMNPEFLREGSGVYDFMNPDKIVLGGIDSRSTDLMKKVYDGFDQDVPRIVTDTVTAEMIKYAQNSMLASRISFMNEVANVCEKVGADVYDVAKAMGIDSRIGPKFLEAGAGFGGACFPKDVKALIATAKSVGVEPVLLNSVMEVNERQPHRVVELLKSAIGNLSGKKISVLGLAFKPNTDDMRESRATVVVEALVSEGAAVKAYDPKSMQNAKQIFSGKPVELASSAESCVEGADACVIMTDWDEFKKLDFSRVKVPVIDGRRTIDPRKAREIGIVYKGIGWKDNYAEAAV